MKLNFINPKFCGGCSVVAVKPAKWRQIFSLPGVFASQSVRQFGLSAIDTFLICLATVTALSLRGNFQLTESELDAFIPYLLLTAICSAILVSLLGLNKTMWRFSHYQNNLRVTGVVLGVCLGAVALSFGYNRLAGVPRSLPILQGVVGIIVLEGARLLYRLFRGAVKHKNATTDVEQFTAASEITVLVVGIGPLAATYLQALLEAHSRKVTVAGFISLTPDCVGLRFANYPILGVAEDIESVLDNLDVHGVTVKRIVVVTNFFELSEKAQKSLLLVEQLRGLSLQFLKTVLDFDDERKLRDAQKSGGLSKTYPNLKFGLQDLQSEVRRPFWKLKSALDLLAALAILLIFAPVLLLVSTFVAVTIGFPLTFWQRRVGLGGRPFYLYKFRTMGPAYSPQGRRLSDAERVSWAGKFMRRSRLDELPQLLNILRGEMSFIGPRPLLIRDQPRDLTARLLVRPGLTGWAQVAGGRAISPDDKLALDIWYVRHAGFFLELSITARTIGVLLSGERVSKPLIDCAWQDLKASQYVKVRHGVS